MSTKMDEYGAQGEIHNTLRSYRVAAQQLPDPSETWSVADLPAELADRVQLFWKRGIVTLVERRRWDDGGNVWRTNARAFKYVDDLRGSSTPCGHTGIQNLGDGEFTCTREACEETFGRAVAEEVLRG